MLHAVLFAAAVEWSTRLEGPWKFRTGDDSRWAQPAYDDRQWSTLSLAAPPEANDGDQGITRFAPGWGANGFAKYAGFAWYRIRVDNPDAADADLAILGPAMADNAYQLYVNGQLLGGIGDFSKDSPAVYGIHPARFTFQAAPHEPINIAVRVWQAPYLAGATTGGMHVAPVVGTAKAVGDVYAQQWFEKIRAFILEYFQTLFFIALAFFARRLGFLPLAVALTLTALWRFNLGFYWMSGIESVRWLYAQTYVLVPLTLGAWTLAWWHVLHVKGGRWFVPLTAILTAVYIAARFWSQPAIWHWDRYAFLALFVYIVAAAIMQKNAPVWRALPAIVLISIGQFASELGALGLPGIWFPFGMGVSLTNYAYLGATLALVWFLATTASERRDAPS